MCVELEVVIIIVSNRHFKICDSSDIYDNTTLITMAGLTRNYYIYEHSQIYTVFSSLDIIRLTHLDLVFIKPLLLNQLGFHPLGR